MSKLENTQFGLHHVLLLKHVRQIHISPPGARSAQNPTWRQTKQWLTCLHGSSAFYSQCFDWRIILATCVADEWCVIYSSSVVQLRRYLGHRCKHKRFLLSPSLNCRYCWIKKWEMVFQVCHQISLITTNTLTQLKHWLLNINAAFSGFKLSNGAVLILAGLLDSVRNGRL